jgi:5,10-methylenetetrahydromethanopterin reductase
MRLSLGITTALPIDQAINIVRLSEENNYYRVWVGEELQGPDIFTYVSILASNTSDIGLGTGITSLWVRNLAVIANSISGIQINSGGRFTAGLGVGGIPELQKILGEKPKETIARVRENIFLLRKIITGEKITIQSDFNDFQRYKLAFKVPSLKIYLGVRGKKMLKLAGEIADGVIFSGPLKPLINDVRIVEKSAKKNGRNPNEIIKVLWNPFVLSEKNEAINLARDVVSVMLGSMPKRSNELVVEREILDLCIYGNKEEIMRKISDLKSIGFNELALGPPYGKNPSKVIESFGRRNQD